MVFMSHISIIHLSVDGHLGGFHFLVHRSTAAVDLDVRHLRDKIESCSVVLRHGIERHTVILFLVF